MGRFLAFCGWLAWQVGRRLRAIPGVGTGPDGVRRGATGLGVALLALSVVPVVLPLFDAQPQEVRVQQIMDGAVTEPSGWVRLSGTVVALQESPTGEEGSWGILADAVNPLRSIIVQGDIAAAIASPQNVTGHLAAAAVTLEPETLPIEATVAGTPPVIVPDRIVNLDASPKPLRASLWPLALLPLLLGGVFLAGARVGYPIFRETHEIDVLTGPLGPGDRVPSAWGGTLGPQRRDLGDPGTALLVVRRGPKGNVLTAQPLNDDGRPSPPVPIGGGWTSGRLGYVHTLTETVPALAVRADEVDVTFLFARTTERDRVAALIAVAR